MTIYETLLFIFVGFVVVFCVFITMALQMTNKELERTQKTVEKQGMLWVYMPFETRFEVDTFLQMIRGLKYTLFQQKKRQ